MAHRDPKRAGAEKGQRERSGPASEQSSTGTQTRSQGASRTGPTTPDKAPDKAPDKKLDERGRESGQASSQAQTGQGGAEPLRGQSNRTSIESDRDAGGSAMEGQGGTDDRP